MWRSRRVGSTATPGTTLGQTEETPALREHAGSVPRSGRHARQALRRATAAAHHVLDHHPLMQRLIETNLTLDSYAESLAAMYRPHVRLERLVHESRHHFESGLELSSRVAALDADLLKLGWTAPVPALPHISPGVADTRAAWWGKVYVLEGSRLGAEVIARCIRSSLGDSAPCRFFSEATHAGKLSALTELLERELAGLEDLEQAEASARAAFASYAEDLDLFAASGNWKNR